MEMDDEYICFLKSSTIFDLFTKIYSENIDLDRTDSSGSTALHIFAKEPELGMQNIRKVFDILRHKANVNHVSNDGRSPLHYAAQNGNHKLIDLLLYFGADVTLRDNNGDTPLHLVSKSNCLVSLALLLNSAHKHNILNCTNRQNKRFDQLLSKRAQVLFYKRFSTLKKLCVPRNQKEQPKQLFDLLSVNSSNLNALIRINDVETVSEMLKSEKWEHLDMSNTKFGYIESSSSKMRSVLKKKNLCVYYGKNSKAFYYLKMYSGFNVNLYEATVKQFLLSSSSPLRFEVSSRDFLLRSDIHFSHHLNWFNYACTCFSRKRVEELVQILKTQILGFDFPDLGCNNNNIDILRKYHPDLAVEVENMVPYKCYPFTEKDLNSEHENCPICREQNVIGDEWIRLICTHRFHESCLYSWVFQHGNCPMCRRIAIVPPRPATFLQ